MYRCGRLGEAQDNNSAMLTETASFVRQTLELDEAAEDGRDFLAAAEADFYRSQIALAPRQEVLASPEKDLSGANVKCVVVGDHGVGKTSLLSRYVLNRFDNSHEPTVLDNYAVRLSINSQPLHLTITDTAGLGDFSALRKLCYRSVDVFLLCFSVVRPNSLHHVLDTWLPELRRYSPGVPILLVGTQVDLRSDLRIFRELMENDDQPVWPERGHRWVKVLKLATYVECSARSGEGLKKVFDEAIWTAIKKKKPAKALSKSHQQLQRLQSDGASSQEDDGKGITCRLMPFSSTRWHAPLQQSHSSSPSSDSGDSCGGSSSSGKRSGMMRKLTRMLSRGTRRAS